MCVCGRGGSSGTHCLKWVDSAGQLMIRTTRAQLRRVGTSSGSTTDYYWPRDWKVCTCSVFPFFHQYKHQSEGSKSSTSGNTTDSWPSDRKVWESSRNQIWSNSCLQLLQILKWACFFSWCWTEAIYRHGDCWPWIAGHVKVVTFWVGRTPNNIFEFLMK